MLTDGVSDTAAAPKNYPDKNILGTHCIVKVETIFLNRLSGRRSKYPEYRHAHARRCLRAPALLQVRIALGPATCRGG
jgi:hypothetical protein